MLDEASLIGACRSLARSEPVFKQLLNEFGVPPLWEREEGFRSLVHIVLEQKISLASAMAVFERVDALCPEFKAKAFMRVPTLKLREAGVSGGKIKYCRAIAAAVVSGELALDELSGFSDEQVRQSLTSVHGIGPWTAGVYLMMALRRPDVWPPGDRALAVGAQEAFKLSEVPSYARLDAMAEAWSPHRASAARMIWHAYLQRRGRCQ